MNIRKGDNVIILAGKDKGKQSKVLKTYPCDGKILVESVNAVKRHQRRKREGDKGQIVTVSMPIDASNAILYCSKCNKGSRSKTSIVGGKKLRVCARCSSEF